MKQLRVIPGLVLGLLCAVMLLPSTRVHAAVVGELGAGKVVVGLEEVGAAEVGMSERGLKRVDALVERAIARGVTPGAALAVGRRAGVVRLRGYGRLDWRRGYDRVTPHTLYDLASLTKTVGTTTAVMLLVQDGKLDVGAPVGRYLPDWVEAGEVEEVTVEQLLTHRSGLRADLPLGRYGWTREGLYRSLGMAGLVYAPGTRTVYSDYGMALLGALVEEVSGEPLDSLLERRVFRPLGMYDTGFNPLKWPETRVVEEAVAAGRSILERTAPTERVKGRYLHGVVHDRAAQLLGGVAGHAGLFSSAADLAVFAQMLLHGGEYGGVRVLEPGVVERFTSRASSRFALGWELAWPETNLADYFSPRAYGHTGFTGTSLWIDPVRDVFVVLLTNRVNPTSRERRHLKLREEVHAAVVAAIERE